MKTVKLPRPREPTRQETDGREREKALRRIDALTAAVEARNDD